jgi:hypothetical protein
MNSALALTVEAAPFVPSFAATDGDKNGFAEFMGLPDVDGSSQTYFHSDLLVPPTPLPHNFDKNAASISGIFERCVALMPDRMQYYAACVDTVCRAFPRCELGGSAVHGGSTFGSDIDIRWMGGEDFRAFIRALGEFAEAHHMHARVLGKNLCKLVGAGMTVDVLIVPDMARLLSRTDDPAYCETSQIIVNSFRANQFNDEKRVIQFNAEKTAMFARCYNKVMTHPVWRSVVVLLKLGDPGLPTCFVVFMVALAAETIRPFEMDQAWQIAMEVMAQFAWRFVQKLDNERHILYSFVEEIWRPFYESYLQPLGIKGCFEDPIMELFNDDQQRNIGKSLFLFSDLTTQWYPLTEVPVSLNPPRSVSQCMPRLMSDFITLVGYEWVPDRELEIRAVSGKLECFYMLSQMYWNTEFMDARISDYMGSETVLSEHVVDAFEAMLA